MDDFERVDLDNKTAAVPFYDRWGHASRFPSTAAFMQTRPTGLRRDVSPAGEVIAAWLGMGPRPPLGLEDDSALIFGTVTLDDAGALVDDQEFLSSSEEEALATHA